jgi:hypothetical protein
VENFLRDGKMDGKMDGWMDCHAGAVFLPSPEFEEAGI